MLTKDLLTKDLLTKDLLTQDLPFRKRRPAQNPVLVAFVVIFSLIAVACSSAAGTIEDGASNTGGTDAADDASVGSTPPTTFDIDAAFDLGDRIEFYQAEEGECLNEYDYVQDREPVNLLIALSCDLPHDKEVYAIIVFDAGPDDPYPGEELMSDIATRLCYNEFAGFVGQSYEESMYDIDLTYPPRENYEVGKYRDIICMVTSPEQTIGSARDTGL